MKHKVISLLLVNEHWEKLENSFYTYMGIITPERLSRTWFLKLSLEKSQEIFLILANKGIIDDRGRVNIAILQRDFESLVFPEISSQTKLDISNFLRAAYLDSVQLSSQDFDRLMHIYSNYRLNVQIWGLVI